MSIKPVQNSFLPRFIVGAFTPTSTLTPTSMTTSATPLSFGLLKMFKENLESAPQVELGVICFEEVSENPIIVDMLDKLVLAIKQYDYQLYQFPQEAQGVLSVETLIQAISEVQGLPHKKVLIFDSRLKHTQKNTTENCKVISTYGLQGLSQSVQYKKDLWAFLQKHF